MNFSLEPLAKEPDKRFFSFEALGNFESDRPGSAVIGNYAVDRRTAEVWDLILCKRVEFAALREARSKLLGSGLLNRSNQVPPTC